MIEGDRDQSPKDQSPKPGPSRFLVKVGATWESRRRAVLDLYRQLTGREPTDEEVRKMDEVIKESASQGEGG